MRKCVLLIIFTLAFGLSRGQNYNLHSVYIYGFTRYVVWPEGYDQGDFEIVVIGDSPIIEALQKMAQAKKVGDRAIKVTRVSSIADVKKCNILFVPAKSATWSDVAAKVNNQPILIITEEPGLGEKGSDINFIMKDGKLAFELNQAAASRQNLKISNQLLSMAILI